MSLQDILASADALARHARHPVVRPQDDDLRALRFDGEFRELDPGAKESEDVRGDLLEVAVRRVVECSAQHARHRSGRSVFELRSRGTATGLLR